MCPWFFQFLKSFHSGIAFCFATGFPFLSFFFFNSSMCYGIFLATCRGLERVIRTILHAVCSIARNQNPWGTCTFLKDLLKTVQLNVSFLLIPPHHPRAPLSSSHSSFEESTTRFAFDSKSWRASSASCDCLWFFRMFFQDFLTPLFVGALLAVVVIDSKLYRQIYSIFAACSLRDF